MEEKTIVELADALSNKTDSLGQVLTTFNSKDWNIATPNDVHALMYIRLSEANSLYAEGFCTKSLSAYEQTWESLQTHGRILSWADFQAYEELILNNIKRVCDTAEKWRKGMGVCNRLLKMFPAKREQYKREFIQFASSWMWGWIKPVILVLVLLILFEWAEMTLLHTD